jgi:signal transduction histidine kinase
VFKKKIKYDGEDAFIVYFKDVTFGVLYEQIKAQKSFQEIINATISHEMRNPLNSIISNCSLLESDPTLNEKARKKVNTMKISCNLLTSFLHDLIDWTQIKLDKFNKKSERFNIRQTFDDVIKMMKFKADIKEIECKVIFQNSMPKFVYGDNQRLMQLAINLISNALKFTFEGGVTTRVKFFSDSNKLYVEVEDTGEGIKQEN